jgi:hypothetical protein
MTIGHREAGNLTTRGKQTEHIQHHKTKTSLVGVPDKLYRDRNRARSKEKMAIG